MMVWREGEEHHVKWGRGREKRREGRELTMITDLRCVKKCCGCCQMIRRIRKIPIRRRIMNSSNPWIYSVYMCVCIGRKPRVY